VYGKFIKVWRQKEAAMQTSQLTRLLLANSAHEVRTPLNAIINYLEIALEGALDSDTRESLTKSHSASKSLIYVINDLLDLTNTEKGQELIKDESFDLETTFKEAADMLSGEARRKNISYTVSVHPGIPHSVLGDQRRVRQVLSNVISNAIQNTASGAVTTEMWRSANQSVPGCVAVEVMVVDTGCGMSEKKLEALFHELEQVSTDETYYPEDEPEPQQSNSPKQPKQRVLGLGLALAARIVHHMQGQLGVRSEEGKGSRFKILLQFKLPEGASSDNIPSAGPVVPPTPMLSDKEFTLIGGTYEAREREGDLRRRSTESLNSGGSSRSGKSQADRLISAMQEPAMGARSPSHGSDVKASDPRQLKMGSPVSAKSHGIVSTSSHGQPLTSPVPAQHLKRSSLSEHRAALSSASHTPPGMLHPLVTPPPPGMENITDSGVPMSALRMSQHAVNTLSPHLQRVEDHSYFPRVKTLTDTSPRSTEATGSMSTNVSPDYELLRVLVAEDDPVNSKIVSKRLTKLGHTVHLTSNGEACATAFGSAAEPFDVVLMDIQAGLFFVLFLLVLTLSRCRLSMASKPRR
jgi:nitrogen-specific signal transduction histidine kinase